MNDDLDNPYASPRSELKKAERKKVSSTRSRPKNKVSRSTFLFCAVASWAIVSLSCVVSVALLSPKLVSIGVIVANSLFLSVCFSTIPSSTTLLFRPSRNLFIMISMGISLGLSAILFCLYPLLALARVA